MLEDAQHAYELHSHNLDDQWRDSKDELEQKLLFGQLPLLEDGDFVLVQTPAILRYISRKLDLLPTSLMDTARADMVADATQELSDRWMTKTMSFGNSAKAKRDYIRHATRILSGLEKILKAKNEGKAYFISDTVSFADYCAWEALDFNLNEDSTFLEGFPLLAAYHTRLPQLRPNLKNYLSSGRRIDLYPQPVAPPSP